MTVNTRDDNGIRIVEMNRPEALNAFSRQLMDDLCDAFIDARDDDAIKVVVLTGAGRAFSAGADLIEMANPPSTPTKHGFPGLIDVVVDFPKPLIVAVNGVGVGVGATIAGLADLTFIAEGARLRCPFSALGLTAEAASTYTFPRLMGHQRASWFLLSAEWISAEDAVHAGLALECCAPDVLMDRALTHARVLAALPLASLRMTKDLLMAPHREGMRTAIKAEIDGLASMVMQPANVEALTAFAEKRDPDFTNL